MNSLLIAVQTCTKFAYIEFAKENYLTNNTGSKSEIKAITNKMKPKVESVQLIMKTLAVIVIYNF